MTRPGAWFAGSLALAAALLPNARAHAACKVPPLHLCALCAPVLEIAIKRDGTCRVRLRTEAVVAGAEPNATLQVSPPPYTTLQVLVQIEPPARAGPVRAQAAAARRARRASSRRCFFYNGNAFCE